MAAPAESNIANLNGVWIMSKTLSDDTDAVLALQGVGWLKRKAIGLSTVTLAIKQYTEDGLTHIDIDSTATGGIKGTAEHRTLDWTPRPHEDHVFGSLMSQNRWLEGSGEAWDELDAFLKEGWLDEKVGPKGEGFVQNYAVNESAGWNARQVWGFAEVDGKRYYVRRAIVTKGTEVLKVRLIYDYQGKA